jgi:hypothetical protein
LRFADLHQRVEAERKADRSGAGAAGRRRLGQRPGNVDLILEAEADIVVGDPGDAGGKRLLVTQINRRPIANRLGGEDLDLQPAGREIADEAEFLALPDQLGETKDGDEALM